MVKRRGNHEGSIYRRPNGKWQALVSFQGKRIAKTFYTKEESQRWIREMSRKRDKGVSYTWVQFSVEEYFADWLIGLQTTLRPNTFHQYQANIQRHILPELGRYRLVDVKHFHLEQFYVAKLENGVGARTIQLSHSILHSAFKKAKHLGLILDNPAALASRPKYERPAIKILSDDQVTQLLIAVEGHRIRPIVYLAVTSGMRQGELLGLRWGDMNWSQNTLRIQRQLQRIKGNGGLIFTNTKTKKSERTINLGNSIVDMLEEHHRDQKGTIDGSGSQESLIFPNSRGNPLEPRRLYKEFKEILSQTDLPDIRFHELRHTAASIMLSSGMPLIQVASQLGHAKTSTTSDIYGHLIPGLLPESVAKIEELVIPIAAELQQADRTPQILLRKRENIEEN